MGLELLEDVVAPFAEGRGAIRMNGVWGYVDRSGRMVIPPQFEWSRQFSEGVVSATDKDHREGYIDLQGKWAIAPQFDAAFSFVNGVAAVYDGHKTYGIDHSGRRVIEPRPDTMLDGSTVFSEPAVRVSRKLSFNDGAVRASC
jgi:hypothetical protein